MRLDAQLGTLYMTTTRLVWCKANAPQPAVSLPFLDIKNQFVSTASSTKALLKLITDETPGAPNIVLEFTHPSSAREDLNMFRESIAQIIPKKNTVRPSVQTNQLCAFAAVKTTPVTAGPPVTSGVAPKPQLSTGKIT